MWGRKLCNSKDFHADHTFLACPACFLGFLFTHDWQKATLCFLLCFQQGWKTYSAWYSRITDRKNRHVTNKSSTFLLFITFPRGFDRVIWKSFSLNSCLKWIITFSSIVKHAQKLEKSFSPQYIQFCHSHLSDLLWSSDVSQWRECCWQ